MPGTSGHCCRYVCPPTPCPTYRRNSPPEVRHGAVWQTDGGGVLFVTDTELTHACLFWQTQMVRTCSGVHATYFGTASSPLHSWTHDHHSSPTRCTHHFRQQFPFPISSFFFLPDSFLPFSVCLGAGFANMSPRRFFPKHLQVSMGPK